MTAEREALRELVDGAKAYRHDWGSPPPWATTEEGRHAAMESVNGPPLDDAIASAESLLSQPDPTRPDECPRCGTLGAPEKSGWRCGCGEWWPHRILSKQSEQLDPVREALLAVVEARDASDEHYRGCDCERCQVLDEILDEIDRQLSKLGGEDKKPKEGERR